jgi:heterodisulfide reductase subunit C
MNEIKMQVKYDAEREPGFARELMKIPGCEKLEHCFQCGTCSGVCPLSIYMDYTPRRIMNLARSGFKKEVLSSLTIWLCSSCYACTVQCPKQIKITDIMYALKQRAIREKMYPKRFPIPVLAREFFKMVHSMGRTTESRLVLNLVLKTNWFKLLGMSSLGLGLIRGGRFSLKSESIRQREQVRRILDSIETDKEVSTR